MIPPDYRPETIRVLRDAEAIRMRPELYIGPLPEQAVLNRLIQEALCLSADEAACGRCTEIAVAVHPDGAVTIRDNGPGVDVEPDEHGSVLAEVLLTVVGACRAAKGHPSAAACCRLGLVIVNALSEWLRVRVFRGGGCWFQEYRKGEPQAPFRREGDARETGLEITFLPDASILGPLKFDALALAAWLPSVGVRYGALEYRPATAESPALLRFTEVTSDAAPGVPGTASSSGV